MRAAPARGEAELLAAERRFDAALLSADVKAPDAILPEGFFLNDSLGGVTRKPELLDLVGSGALRFHKIVPHDLSVHLYRDAAIADGWTERKAEFRGAVSEMKSRFSTSM